MRFFYVSIKYIKRKLLYDYLKSKRGTLHQRAPELKGQLSINIFNISVAEKVTTIPLTLYLHFKVKGGKEFVWDGKPLHTPTQHKIGIFCIMQVGFCIKPTLRLKEVGLTQNLGGWAPHQKKTIYVLTLGQKMNSCIYANNYFILM